MAACRLTSSIARRFVTAAVMMMALLLAACEQPDQRELLEPSAPAAPAQPSRLPDRVPTAETITISVVFTLDEEPQPVPREVPADADTLVAALEELLRGPAPEERATGISSWFSEQTASMLNKAEVDEEGHAVIDFADFRRVIPGASSSAGSRILLNELTGTVAQFELIQSIEYQLEGSCHRFWTFLQRGCEILDRAGGDPWTLH